MEDSFKVRVDKIFGSLSSSSSPSPSLSLSSSSSLSSLWCLTDEEIEKKEWNREKGSPEPETAPYPPHLDGFFANQQDQQQRRMVSESKSVNFGKEIEKDLEDLDDEIEDGIPSSSKQSAKPDDHDDEEWEIRSSVGLDCTLDYEEEEDEYDKVAVGREKAGDRLFMTEFNDYGICSNSYNELPRSIRDVARDPRANLMAAKLRLKEDVEAAGDFDSLTVSGKTKPDIVGAQAKTTEDISNLKSILKRKESLSDSRSQKRVRFDPECKNDCREEESEKEYEAGMQTSPMEENPTSNVTSFPPQDQARVPDYIRNPSKYICYTLDSSNEEDEESNRKAYMDFLETVRRSKTMESLPEDASVELPKSVTFMPRKKAGKTINVKNSADFNQNGEDAGRDTVQRKALPISIAAGDVEESDVSAMEEDEPEAAADNSNSSRKSGRQYRTKIRPELDCIT